MANMTAHTDHLLRQITTAESLDNLLDALRTFENCYDTGDREEGEPLDTEGVLRFWGVDICELPTFGGTEPASTIGVWSWDEDRLLVGEGPFADWRIRDRE